MNINRFVRKLLIYNLFISIIILSYAFYEKKFNISILSINKLHSLVRHTKLIKNYQSINLCKPLDNSVKDLLGSSLPNWSISVQDEKGTLILDINSYVPRIPASNQKLVTTAYALHKLGPDFRLKTTLLRRIDGVYALYGQGDPDILPSKISEIAQLIYQDNKSSVFPSNNISLLIYEEPKQLWYPDGWLEADKLESYGSPITRLAVSSNTNYYAIRNPTVLIKNIINGTYRNYNQNSDVFIRRHKLPIWYQIYKTIKVIYSVPMQSLLSLSNSESHNFTAEVLLRNSLGSWNVSNKKYKIINWLHSLNIPTDGFNIVDGSGLSRHNKLTSIGLSNLIYKMKEHKYSHFFDSSMAIAGLRGTLSNKFLFSNIENNFAGKSGTLKGVRTLSGTLNTQIGERYISILSMDTYKADDNILNILELIYKFSPCN